jgi:hypothetical protein
MLEVQLPSSLVAITDQVIPAGEANSRAVVGRLVCWGELGREDIMSNSKKPLRPEDFPVDVEGRKIKKQDGTPIANAEDPAVAADVAERLNDDEARREEDKWSA